MHDIDHLMDNAKILTLKLMVVIVDRDKGKEAIDNLRRHHPRIIHVIQGKGTASSEIMDMLGLGGVDKAVLLCVIPHFLVNIMIEDITEKMKLTKHGKGIVFSIPLSGVSARICGLFSGEMKDFLEKQEKELDQRMAEQKNEVSHDLIIAVVNLGSSEDLMESARSAGATGGTALHAHRVGSEEASKFFGISVQPEKEVIAILTRRENKKQIMQAICRDCGIQTDAGGLVFSLPVDAVSGISQE